MSPMFFFSLLLFEGKLPLSVCFFFRAGFDFSRCFALLLLKL